MPDQLFAFHCGYAPGRIKRTLLIGASSEREAKLILARFLEARPTLAGPEFWILSQVCGKLDHGIFSIDTELK